MRKHVSRSRRHVLEVAVETCADVDTACAGGADRLEVCAALDLGGITPSAALLRHAVASKSPALALIRPRPGDFVYSKSEFEQMRIEMEDAIAAGAAGVVFGILDRRGRIDMKRCAQLIALCGRRAAVFHRAFDLLHDRTAGLETLIRLGFRRVLTSGGEPKLIPTSDCFTALSGLVELADRRIEILPGGGARPAFAAQLLRRTHCTQIHASCRKLHSPAQAGKRGPAGFGFGGGDDGSYSATDLTTVRKMRAAIDAARPTRN